MSTKRMVARELTTDSNAYNNLSRDARLFYMYALVECDDDGVINDPIKFAAQLRFNGEEISAAVKELSAARLVLPVCDTVVITHMATHNYLDPAKYHHSERGDVMCQVGITADGNYTTDLAQATYRPVGGIQRGDIYAKKQAERRGPGRPAGTKNRADAQKPGPKAKPATPAEPSKKRGRPRKDPPAIPAPKRRVGRPSNADKAAEAAARAQAAKQAAETQAAARAAEDAAINAYCVPVDEDCQPGDREYMDLQTGRIYAIRAGSPVPALFLDRNKYQSV